MKFFTLTLILLSTISLKAWADGSYWIDVRTESEYSESHHPKAVLIPYDTILETIEQLTSDKSAQIYLYCGSGRRAGIAKDTLEKLGYTHVKNVGGLQDALNYSLDEAKPTTAPVLP